MNDRLAWLQARRGGLGGSDIAAIAGVHPYNSAWSVYWDKIADEEAVDEPAGEAAHWGQLLEDVVADEWIDRQDHPDWRIERSPLLAHPEHEWWIGTPDRLIRSWTAGHAPLAVLEIKLAGPEAWRWHWDGGTTIPVWYEAQAQWYLGLTGLHVAHFAVLVEGRRLETRHVERDDQTINRLADIGRRFWHDHVLAGTPPAPDGGPRTRGLLDDRYPPRDDIAGVVLPAGVGELLDEYRAAAAAVKGWEKRKEAAANGLIAVLGQAEATDGYLTDDDADAGPAVTYRAARYVDWDSLEAEVGAQALEACRRPTYDTKAAEKAVGRKLVDQHRRPGGTRRLHVRNT